MKAEAITSLQVKKSFSASPERVFDAWIDPERAKKFLFATPTGEIVRCDIDARPGGKFTITRRDPSEGGDVEHTGEYKVVDRPGKLVFTFGVPKYSELFTTVTIDIAATDSGCDLTLTHEDVLADWSEKSREGWAKILETLATYLK